MLYSCTHMETVGVKGLTKSRTLSTVSEDAILAIGEQDVTN